MVKTQGSLLFNGISSTAAEDNSVFLDSSDNKIKFVDSNSNILKIEKQLSQNKLLTLSGLNRIRQMKDRTVDFSADDKDGFSELYTDSNGLYNTIDLANSFFAYCDTDGETDRIGYLRNITNNESSGDTPHAAIVTWTNASNGYDNDTSTYATCAPTNTQLQANTIAFGTTFSAKTIQYVSVNFYMDINRIGYSGTNRVILQTYDGSTWSDVQTLFSSSGVFIYSGGTVYLNASVQGIRLLFYAASYLEASGHELRVSIFSYSTDTVAGDCYITHDVDSGTFNATPSSGFGVAFINDTNWETGDTVQYKIANAGEDSGWIGSEEVTGYTALTSEPTKVLVKLDTPGTTATYGYPAIEGIWVYTE